MKTCKNARNCEWGHSTLPNTCAYKDNMCEYDSCPKVALNYEYLLDKITNNPEATKKLINTLTNMKEGAEYVK